MWQTVMPFLERNFFSLCCVDVGSEGWIISDVAQPTKQISPLRETFSSVLWWSDWTLSWNCNLSRCSEACNRRWWRISWFRQNSQTLSDTVWGLIIKQILYSGSIRAQLYVHWLETYCCFRCGGVTGLMLIYTRGIYLTDRQRKENRMLHGGQE